MSKRLRAGDSISISVPTHERTKLNHGNKKRQGQAMVPIGSPRGWVGSTQAARLALQGHPENKYHDVGFSSTTNVLTISGYVQLINGIEQGADATQRIGRKIRITSIGLNMYITHKFAAAPNVTVCEDEMWRLMIVYDHSPNGTLATITDLFEADGGGSVSGASHMNLANRMRFKIVWSEVRMLGFIDLAQGVSLPTENEDVSLYRKLNLETTYGGTTDTMGDIRTGALLFVAISTAQTNAVTDSGRILHGQMRLRYTDA